MALEPCSEIWLIAERDCCTIEDKRACDREKEKGLPPERRRAAGRLVEGQVVTNWKKALAQLAIAYPDLTREPNRHIDNSNC
ncbi:hypothetical protein KILIM_151_00020, partial [Kineosphaera limosa NBRC 100340]